jgi:hypothetical protein
VELGLARVRPLDPVQPALRPLQGLVDPVEPHAENRERRVAEKDQPSAGAEESCRLRDPAEGISPDRGAVFRDDKVEGRVGQRYRFADRLHEREVEPELLLHLASRRELCRSRVDADRSCATLREPGRNVRRAAAEIEDVEAGYVAKNLQPLLGVPEDAEVELVLRP